MKHQRRLTIAPHLVVIVLAVSIFMWWWWRVQQQQQQHHQNLLLCRHHYFVNNHPTCHFSKRTSSNTMNKKHHGIASFNKNSLFVSAWIQPSSQRYRLVGQQQRPHWRFQQQNFHRGKPFRHQPFVAIPNSFPFYNTRLFLSTKSRGGKKTSNKVSKSAKKNVRPLETKKDNLNDEEEEALLEELKSVAIEIQRHDNAYYNGTSIATTGDSIISDEEYDALVLKEAQLCIRYPRLPRKLEQQYGITTRYAGRIGSGTSTVQQLKLDNADNDRDRIKHVVPMLSLDNGYSKADIKAWIIKSWKRLKQEGYKDDDVSVLDLMMEPKLDGVSLSLRYNAKTGHFIEAATRGDGVWGQNVTLSVLDMSNIPLLLPPTDAKDGILEIRGEVVMPSSVFARLQSQQEDSKRSKKKKKKGNDDDDEEEENVSTTSFSTSRNAASGILLRKSTTTATKRNDDTQILCQQLQFYAYDAVLGDDNNNDKNSGEGVFQSGQEMRSTLQEWGFQVPHPFRFANVSVNENQDDGTIQVDGLDSFMEYYEQLYDYKRQGPPIFENDDTTIPDFDTDGAVYKLSLTSLRDTLGTATRAPRWALAHKFPSRTAITKLLNITVQVGRTGVLTPVAELEPVQLGGGDASGNVTIQRATLHNFVQVQDILGKVANDELSVGDNKLTQIPSGTLVMIRRAGDVIPQIVQKIDLTSMSSLYNTKLTFGADENDLAQETKKKKKNQEDEIEMISLLPPTSCPACGSAVVQETIGDTKKKKKKKDEDNEGDNNKGVILRCTGSMACPPQRLTSLCHAFSREALDIRRVSEARIQQLMDADLLTYPSDLFSMDYAKLETLPGWGEKSVQNLKINVERVSKQDGVSLGRFIYSLGIRHCGLHTSNLLAEAYEEDIHKFLTDLELSSMLDDNEDYREGFQWLRQAKDRRGIGPAVYQALHSFSRDRRAVKATLTLAESVKVKNPSMDAVHAEVDAIAEALRQEMEGTNRKFDASALFEDDDDDDDDDDEDFNYGDDEDALIFDENNDDDDDDDVNNKDKYWKRRLKILPPDDDDDDPVMDRKEFEGETFTIENINDEEYLSDIDELIVPGDDEEEAEVDESFEVADRKWNHETYDFYNGTLPWEGYSVVFTGALPNNMTRAEGRYIAKKLLGAAKTPTTLSKSTDMLIVGRNHGGKKMKAFKYGIPMMPGEDFVKLIKIFKEDYGERLKKAKQAEAKKGKAEAKKGKEKTKKKEK